ncbi:hypothetical protein GCM10008090_29340 [Arenicella chitinivorans]|uniref:Insecticide toxin TcdB middle/N-terminal domain-containing protein n=1 Tax=Arenicella chitinivorans TaxID=1329800 RepID=A0A918RZ19_9GAMM|nr:hypothetical protein GCM10008090_29340 [Arenicella chitinivorans]
MNGNRLILVAGSHGADLSEYRTELGTNQKIIIHGANITGPSYFTVKNPDGRTFYYGSTTDSRVELQGKDVVHFWALSKVEDHLGNYIAFEYFEDNESGQFYPKYIRYTGNESQGLSPYNSIELKYDGRSDPYYSCVAGSLVQTAVKLKEIAVFKHVPSSRYGGDGADQSFRRYLMSYGDEEESVSSTVPNDACDSLTTEQNNTPTPYQLTLDSRYEASSSRVARLDRYDYVETLIGTADTLPDHVLLSELLQSYVSQSDDRSSGFYQTLLNDLNSLASGFDELAEQTMLEYSSLSNEEQLAYVSNLESTVSQLESEVQANRESRIGELEAQRTVLESAKQRVVQRLDDYIAKQLKKADRILLVPQDSPYKTQMMENFKNDLKLKYQAATKAADDCLAFVQLAELQDGSYPSQYTPCYKETSKVEEAFNAFVHYGEAASTYFGLYTDLESLTLSPGVNDDGQVIPSLVERSKSNHAYHLLVAGQVTGMYRKFAAQLRKDSIRQIEDLVAKIDEKLQYFEIDSELLAGEYVTDEELQLRESTFVLGLLNSGQSSESYTQDYIAEIEASITDLMSGQDIVDVEGVTDGQTNLIGVLNNLRIIQDRGQEDTLVNYQSILDGLLHGEGAVISQRSSGAANSLLGDTRLISLIECGAFDACYTPIKFKWTEEVIGWNESPSSDVVPDYLLSYDKVRAGNEGLTIDTGSLGGGTGDGQSGSALSLSNEETLLGKELAQAGQLVDVNGDGFQDWVIAYRREDGSEFRGTWINTQAGWQYSEEYTLPALISLAGGIPLGSFIDTNNDGFLDWVGRAILPNGEVIESAYNNTQSGWVSSTESRALFHMVYVDETGYRVGGYLFRAPEGELNWISSASIAENQEFWTYQPSGWTQQTGQTIPFSLATDSEAAGIVVDVDSDGIDEWVEYHESDGVKSLRVWRYAAGAWAVDTDLEITNIDDFKFGEFIDLNGDTLLDWVVSVVDDDNQSSHRTLVQGPSGWEVDTFPSLPALQDSDGNHTAHLHDIDGDGVVEWLRGISDTQGVVQTETQKLIDGVWTTQPQLSLLFEISRYSAEGMLETLGEFATLTGQSSIDWLNESQIWSQSEPSTETSSMVSDAGVWQSTDAYRLPVLEDQWIRNVSELLARVKEGESVLAEDQNVVAAAENGGESGSEETDAGEGQAVALEVPVPSDDSNGVKTGTLIDVDGDGRLDWVKSVKFSTGVEQKVVWLRSDVGWKRSETFVPPIPLVDFTNRSVAKVVDINSDGLPDFLLSLSIGSSPVNELWLNTGENWVKSSGFDMPRSLFTKVGGNTYQTAVLIDLNRDGLLDILSDGSDGRPKGAWLANPNGYASTTDFSFPFTFSSDNEGDRISNGQFIDLNGDGLLDWINYSTQVGQGDLVYLNSGSIWQESQTYQLPISLRHTNGDIQALLVDLNNDNYQDLALSYLPNDAPALGSTWLNTGVGWRLDERIDYHLPGTMFLQGHGLVAHLLDINADGYTDFIQSVEGGSALTNNQAVWLGSKTGFKLRSPDSSIPALMQRLENGKLVTEYVLADADGDLEQDLVRSTQSQVTGSDVYFGLFSIGGTINKIFDGTKRSEIAYEKGFKPFSVYPTEERATYPLQSTNGPAVVVSGYRSFLAEGLDSVSGESLLSDVVYAYSGYAFDLLRGQGVGFKTAESTDWIAERVSLTEFAQTFPHTGRAEASQLSQLWGDTISRTDYQYDIKIDSATSDLVKHSYLQRTTTKNYKEDGDQLNTIETDYLDPLPSYFYPRKEHQTLFENGVEHHTLTTHEITPNENFWLLTQQTENKVESWNSIKPDEVMSVVTGREFDSRGLLHFESVANLTTRYTFGPFGNLLETAIGVNSTLGPRVESSIYDLKGRFRIGTQNIADEITELEYTGVTDEPSLIRANDSSFVEYEYDGFGRKARETASSGVIRPFDIKFCNGLSANGSVQGCPEGAAYLTAQFSNEEKGSAAEVVYYDKLGREVRRATASAENILYIDTEYYLNGKVSSRTVPYIPGSDTEVQKVTFGYDTFGRLAYTEEPGGVVKAWVYDGRSVTEYDPNGNATTTINTHFGLPSKIIDAYENETEYFYNALGQLTGTVNAQLEETRTIITYDEFGRKQTVTDPNHGVTTFSHNAFGEITSKTDALGNKQVFIYDEYGRLEQRIDSGVNAQGQSVPSVTATWEYYDLSEAKIAYQTYLTELTEREVAQEEIAKINELVYLNPEAASSLVKRVSDTTGYVSTSTYDYRSRAVENTVTLPNSGGTRTLKTDYLGESQLPYTVYYPNNLSVRYEYDEFGYLSEVKNAGLNTRDHYFGLLERGETLRDEVAEAIYQRAIKVNNDDLKPNLSRYKGYIRKAEEAEDKAIVAARRIEHFTPQVYDDRYAVEHLKSKLLQITSQTEEEARNNVVTSLFSEFSGGSLAINSSANCTASRNYTFHVPAYDVTTDIVDPDAPEVAVQVPIYEYDHERRAEVIIGYEIEMRAPEPEKRIERSEAAKSIERYLPGVCVPDLFSGYPDIPNDKFHRKRERQLVDHILGLMRVLRERSNANESTISNNIRVFEKQAQIAKNLYSDAKTFYDNHVEKYVRQVSDLNQAGNEVSLKAFEVFVKASRVYQFHEVERDISFWKIEKSDEINRVVRERYGNGVVNHREYDPVRGSLHSIRTKADHQEHNYQNEAYYYDLAGNLVSKGHYALSTTEAYQYDDLNRLKTAQYTFFGENEDNKVTQEFTYDALGNIKSKTGVGDYAYHPNKVHAVVAAGERAYTYDAIGRMRTGDGATFEYTTFSKPSRITEENGNYATFAYGPTHDRYYQKRSADGKVDETFYFFKGVYEETKSAGQLTQHASIGARGKNIAVIKGYEEPFVPAEQIPELGAADALADDLRRGIGSVDTILGNYFSAFDSVLNAQPIVESTSTDEYVPESQMTDCYEVDDDASTTNGSEDPKRLHCLTPIQYEQVQEVAASSLINIQYYHYDALDSVKLVTDADGEIAAVNYFDAFGNPIIRPENEEGETAEGDMGLGGHEAIVGMDLVHMNGRIYDPVIGRFLSADPFVPAILNPQSLNRYSYVYNNPLKYVDPSGYKPVTASQHERNEYIFVSLAYFELEVVLPSSQHLYDLLALSRHNPRLFEEHITAWGSSPEKWNNARGYAISAYDTNQTVQAIRAAERDAKYLQVVQVVITAIVYYYGGDGTAAGEAFMSQWYAAPVLSTAAQVAITGEIDIESAALSFATAYVGSKGFGDYLDGVSKSTHINRTVLEAATSGVIRGYASHLSGGEFEHGFAAGVASVALDRSIPNGGSGIVRIIRSGVIEGLVTEISNGRGSDGEKLDFWNGFQLGALRALATEVGILAYGRDGQTVCRSGTRINCDLSVVGDALNLIIEGEDGLIVLNTLVQAGFSIYRFNQNFVVLRTRIDLTHHVEDNNGRFYAENEGQELSEIESARNTFADEAITEARDTYGSIIDMSDEAFGELLDDLVLIHVSSGLASIQDLTGEGLVGAFYQLGLMDGSLGAVLGLPDVLGHEFAARAFMHIGTKSWQVKGDSDPTKNYRLEYTSIGEFEVKDESGKKVADFTTDHNGNIVGVSLETWGEGEFDAGVFPEDITRLASNFPTSPWKFVDGGPQAPYAFESVQLATGERVWMSSNPALIEQESINAAVAGEALYDFITYEIPGMSHLDGKITEIRDGLVLEASKLQGEEGIIVTLKKYALDRGTAHLTIAEFLLPDTVGEVGLSMSGLKVGQLFERAAVRAGAVSATRVGGFTIRTPIPNGDPGAIYRGFAGLNSRQKVLLDELSNVGDSIIVSKRSVSQKDIAALTAQTGQEFAVFTVGGRRMVVRGNSSGFDGIIDEAWASTRASEGWRFSAHTHPIPDGVNPSTVLRSSVGDRGILELFPNNQSAILNSEGGRVLFTPTADSLSGWLPD